MSGSVEPATTGDLALALAPEVCLKQIPLMLDLGLLNVSPDALPSVAVLLRNAAQTVDLSVTGIGLSLQSLLANLGTQVRLLPVLPVDPSSSSQAWWQLHSYELADRNSACAFARRIVGDLAAAAGLTTHDVDGMRIAVSEAVCNAFRHGSSPESKSSVRLRCVVATDALDVMVIDCGEGFDPARVKAQDRPLREGGRGIGIMYKTVDEVRFDFESGTMVTLRKRLDCEANR